MKGNLFPSLIRQSCVAQAHLEPCSQLPGVWPLKWWDYRSVNVSSTVKHSAVVLE